MMPGEQEVQAATGSSFWTAVIAIWLVLFAIAATLALALAIWNLLEAF
jgi:hypothetical protein